MMYGWEYGNNGYDIWGFVFMLLVTALLVVGVVLAIRALNHGANEKKEDEALTLLRKRYASGEIKKEEYEEKRAALNS